MNDGTNEKTSPKKSLIIVLIILILISIFAACVTVWALFFRNTPMVVAPDYAPIQGEENAVPIENDDTEKLEQEEGGGAVSLTYSKEVAVNLTERQASLMFANPGKSNQDMLVQLVIDNTVIAQSGIIKPGYQVTLLDLEDGIELSEGTYSGKFIVSYYNEDIGEKSIVNTEIPLEISANK